MASTRANSKVAKGSLWSTLSSSIQILHMGHPRGHSKHSWRKAMREARLSASYAAKKTPLVGDTTHNGDHLGVISASTPGGQATKLETPLPRRADRRLVRAMRLGMIGQTGAKWRGQRVFGLK